ncbi:MAG: PaaI family thioesterase [Proteobacteria bacterium]|nr:PaaI family thioesterase [Pseudomonadota bacterium]
MQVGIPFNKFLGLEAVEVSKGYAVLRLPFREEFVGDPTRPALHGGTISMLVDTAGGAAVFTAGDPGDTCSTIDLRIDYLRRGELTDLIAEARVVRLGNRVGVARIQVFQDSIEDPDAGRRLIAEATAVYNLRRAHEATGQFVLERR